MMEPLFLYGTFTVVIIILMALLINQRSRVQKLEKLLEHNSLRLEQLQVDFGRFAPQEVIERITGSDDEYAPSMRAVTVLFADIKGFTKMCHSMEPSTIVSILNGYFQCMSRAISKHHGEITEMMGDGLLALFGAIDNNPWQVQDAVLAALAMRKELKAYNEKLKSNYLPQLSIGMGIHQGEVLAGIMGNYKLSKFGVVGDTINVASRVEGLCRPHDVDLLITEEVKQQLDHRFELKEMPALEVKGKDEPIVTYWVIG